MNNRLQGLVALVTGGGRGIGKAIAIAFAYEGAKVVVAARTESEVAETAEQIRELGGQSIGFPCDVSKREDVQKLINKVLKQYDRLDILVNSAGACIIKTLSTFTEQEWNTLIDVNLKGVFLCARAVWDIFVQQGGGVIINISSQSGKRGRAKWSVYSATKFGIIGFTESLALEGKPYRIRVNAICPEGTDTSMQRSINHYLEKKEYKLDLIKPEDVARVAVFLACDESRAVTGSTVDVRKGLGSDN